MSYIAYYIPRTDGDFDLVALLPSPDEGDEELLEQLHLGVKRALFSTPHITREFGDPEAPSVLVLEEEEAPKDFKKDSLLWGRIFDAIKIEGNFDDALTYMEESLTGEQYDEIKGFFDWLMGNNYTIGHGNYWTRYQEYKKSLRSHPAFGSKDGSVDGVTYQRSLRDEWEQNWEKPKEANDEQP